MITLEMTVNGRQCKVTSHPMARLLDILREQLQLTGTKEGCGEGECGACSILVNGMLVNSCLMPFAQCEGANIRTIEGLTDANGILHPIQKAFLECGGAQCGICTPGMVMAAVQLLESEQDPTDEQIRTALGGNICRCTGYTKIFSSVARAAELMRGMP